MGEQIEKLAQFIARTGWDDMPEAVHRRAKLVLLDTIGVTLAGAARPEVIGLRERLLLGAGRGATVLAAGLPQADIRTAALLVRWIGFTISESALHFRLSWQPGRQPGGGRHGARRLRREDCPTERRRLIRRQTGNPGGHRVAAAHVVLDQAIDHEGR